MNNKLIVGVDFDGTCVTHEFPEVGNEIGAEKVLKELKESGCDIVLTTMRCDKHLDEAIKWFYDRDIQLNGIYHHETQKAWTTSPKCYCHILIDDCSLGAPMKKDTNLSRRPFIDWDIARKQLISKGFIK